MPADIDTYKSIRANFIEKDVSHYTYKLKSERAYRVVLRGLHSSEDTESIKQELYELEDMTSGKLQNEGKTPGYDPVDAKLLKELPEKWKIAQVVMIPKPGKPLYEASSYRPISLLSVPGRCFEVKYNNESSPLQKINSGVPQGSLLGPVLYLIFTADIPTHEETITATYADDTALLSVDKDPSTASAKLQAHVFKVENWLDKWRIRVNQGKSVHVTFTLRRETCPPIKLHNEEIPQSEDAKYLGMHLDRRLTWRKHIWTKRKQLDTQLRSMYWLMGRKSNLSHESKIAIYKTILKPIWTYGIQLWALLQ
ncbi:RNA-directed DNA polymerase from mobile element jockey [Eumeta japonica]|uniref:RNA-directed DNA polymerase from mobile element jockey n=1 Tax=Eumeta variegata TaxID=151549 RepID=A0A4C1XE42_EUMVA|nr:RNA-directed DNA polymerase from mobile element jockey [Eumeta japonica]